MESNEALKIRLLILYTFHCSSNIEKFSDTNKNTSLAAVTTPMLNAHSANEGK